MAGSDKNGAKDIMDFFKGPEVNAIIVSRGGQGLQRILLFLDYNVVANNPKIFVGFSATTALQLGIPLKNSKIYFLVTEHPT